jgi:protoheme IX farnesyltransferase
LVTVAGGFFLGSRGNIHYPLLFATFIGISLIIACGCVFNNFIDQDIDKIMERTKNRVLVQGLVSPKLALLYATILGILGSIILFLKTNHLTLIIALLGLFVYVVVYSLWLKRSSVYGTLIGSISGSVPPVAGYCAATNRFDMGAILLFLILTFWQMPHSYAIAIYRLNDYKAAGIPVLPVKNGIANAKIHMLIYTILFIFATLMLTLLNYTGYIYFVVVAVLGLRWLWISIKGFHAPDNRLWARQMFLFSIIIITLLSLMMSIDYIPFTSHMV